MVERSPFKKWAYGCYFFFYCMKEQEFDGKGQKQLDYTANHQPIWKHLYRQHVNTKLAKNQE